MNGKLAYSLGGIATALSSQIFSTYIIFFYVDRMKLPVGLAGIAMLIYSIWNAINDPLFGYLSDITRSRFGRRIPYLAAAAVPLGIVFFLLWVPPFASVDQEFFLFLYFLLMICLFDGLYSLIAINWTSLFPEMYPDLRTRSQVNAFRQGFVMIGLLIGIAVPPLIYSRWGWGAMGAIFGGLITLVVLTTLLGSREDKRDRAAPSLPPGRALNATFNNRSFMTFALANLFVQFAFNLILASIPFFAKYVLRAGPMETTQILAAAFLIAIPMLFVWKRLTLRFGAKYCFMGAMAAMTAFLFPLLYVNSFGGVLLIACLIGSGMAGFLFLADIILSDVIDEDEISTGTRREGMFFGSAAFVNRFAIGLGAFSMSAVFIVSGYTPYIFTQTQSFRDGLRLLIAGLPMIALILAFAIMIWYPLAGKKLAEIQGRKGVN